jgi:hypothetical protein
LPTFGRPTMATVKLMTKGSGLLTPLYARRQRWAQSANKANYPLFFGLSVAACYHFATERRFHDLSGPIVSAMD